MRESLSLGDSARRGNPQALGSRFVPPFCRYHRRTVQRSGHSRRVADRRGFTLAEALIAITVATVTGAALMISMTSAVQTTQYTLDQMLAAGVAEQIVDEVMAQPYHDVSGTAYDWPLGAEAGEWQGMTREYFDDIDDFDDYDASPPRDVYGKPLGQRDPDDNVRHNDFHIPEGYLDQWRVTIDVYYVDESNPSVRLPDASVSGMRAVEVRVSDTLSDGSEQELTTIRRVFGYVPSL